MLLRSLDAILTGKVPEIGRRWVASLRSADKLRALSALKDEELLSIHEEIVRTLARWFEMTAGKNEIGAFFVMVGKEYCAMGVPVSELTWALSLDRKAFMEYILENEELEGPMRMYAMMDAADRIADFFLLAAYYLTKGFLEETFLRMRKGEKLSDDILGKYFKDEFFFKN